LAAAGLSAARREGLGSNVIFDALKAGDIDVYVDYSGTLWANQLHRDDTRPREEVLADVKTWLADHGGVAMLGALGFENAYALAMTRSHAEKLGVRSIADLASRAPTLTIAGDYEFFARPEWAAIRRAYGLKFAGERQMQPEFMYPAVSAGEVDVISAYSSHGRLAQHPLLLLPDAQHDLTVLADPKHAIPP